MKKQKKTAKYLYGCSGTDFMDMGYVEALEYKIIKGRELLNLLSNENYMVRDNERINCVLKAIKFNIELIEETDE